MYDIGDYIFSFGLFFTLFFLFAKYLPVVNMAEVKSVMKGVSSNFPAKKAKAAKKTEE
jgi:molybdopterin-containing oxidoreductase family membrane subunit